jgi:hypothetical protein
MEFLVFRLGRKLFKHISIVSPLKPGNSIVRPQSESHVEISYNKNRHIGCNYHNSGHYPTSCLLFKTQFNSISLSVPHRKYITSPIRAQQVNAINRFVTLVY